MATSVEFVREITALREAVRENRASGEWALHTIEYRDSTKALLFSLIGLADELASEVVQRRKGRTVAIRNVRLHLLGLLFSRPILSTKQLSVGEARAFVDWASNNREWRPAAKDVCKALLVDPTGEFNLKIMNPLAIAPLAHPTYLKGRDREEEKQKPLAAHPVPGDGAGRTQGSDTAGSLGPLFEHVEEEEVWPF